MKKGMYITKNNQKVYEVVAVYDKYALIKPITKYHGKLIRGNAKYIGIEALDRDYQII